MMSLNKYLIPLQRSVPKRADRLFSTREGSARANIVLIGAGWWSQGWHLPHLSRNENVNISAIVDSSPHPKSNLNPNLEPLDSLASRYNCPVYYSLSDLLQDPVGQTMDGAIVCTPHSTHFDIGRMLIEEGKRRYNANKFNYRPINVLMEKPMTTNVKEAKQLCDLLMDCRIDESVDVGGERSEIKSQDTNIGGGVGCFLINHSANYRYQARAARSLIESGKLGTIRHVSAFFASPLSWIFDDPANTGWNDPDDSGEMLGNGFAWGQSSHLLAWIYHVAGTDNLIPEKVYCAMTTSEHTGADVSHAATVVCTNGATFSLSGTSLLPGNAHSDPPIGKRIKVKIFGTKGALVYSGIDRDPSSGRLEWLRGDDDNENLGAVEIQCAELGFEFEDLDQSGIGPQSLQCFVDACLGREEYYNGADVLVGFRSVQTIDAMYRSHVSGNAERVFGR